MKEPSPFGDHGVIRPVFALRCYALELAYVARSIAQRTELLKP